MAELLIHDNGDLNASRTFELTTNRILIGSNDDNQLVLQADSVAAVHVSLEFRQNRWVLQDLGSEQGTIINGEMVDEPYALNHADTILVGNAVLQFQTDYELADEAVSQPLPDPEQEISGRWWFAQVFVATFTIIVVIILTMWLLGLPLPGL